jgi:hypothetical protein
MTWQQMHDMTRSAYIEGVKAGIKAVKTQRRLSLSGKLDDEDLQWMWEHSEINRELPESTSDTPEVTATKRRRGFLAG